MHPYLLVGMADDYDAIRIISERAYKSLPGGTALNYDFLDADRQAVIGDELQRIRNDVKLEPCEALLINEDGTIDAERFNELMRNRNQRLVYLRE